MSCELWCEDVCIAVMQESWHGIRSLRYVLFFTEIGVRKCVCGGNGVAGNEGVGACG